MSPSNKERVVGFVEQLVASLRDVGGKQGIDGERLESLVRDDPDAAAGAVLLLLQAEEALRGSRQLGAAVAAAYQRVTGDDSLALRAKRQIEESGGRMPMVVDADGQPPPATGGIGALQVTAEDLERGDIYNLLRIFQVDRLDNPAMVVGLRGRFLLLFPVDDDPRPVWQIPAVREFVRKLFEAMPYFPYYLHLAQEAGSFMLFFGCLADADAFQRAGRKAQLSEGIKRMMQIVRRNREMTRRQGLAAASPDQDEVVWLTVTHPSVMAPVAVSASAIRELCRRLGEDPTEALNQLLMPYDPRMRSQILGAVSELGERDGNEIGE